MRTANLTLCTIFLSQPLRVSFYFRTNPLVGELHLHQFAIVCAILSLFDNNFILIGHSKQFMESRRARGVVKHARF